MEKNCCSLTKCYQNLSYSIVNTVQTFFYKCGLTVASRPWTTMVTCWLFLGFCCFGFIRFHHEKNPIKLWVPSNSEYAHDSEWIMQKFQVGYRTQMLLVEADDVLVPEVLKQINIISKRVEVAQSTSRKTWSDVCFKIPVIDFEFSFKKKRDAISDIANADDNEDGIFSFDPSDYMGTASYCRLVENLKKGCLQNNILEFWKFDDTKLKRTTKQDILNKLAAVKISPVTGHPTNYEKLLGGVKRNETGHIISARALLSLWMVYVNFTEVDMTKSGNDAGTADWASESVLDWENEFLKVMEDEVDHVKNMTVYFQAGRSYGDISSSSMFQDIGILMIGIMLMVIYVQIVISKFNWVEARVMLGSVGLLCVGMAFISACGLCSLFGVPYGPVHTSFPFLLMGLGVDDMFVIMACWEELPVQQKRLPLPERVAHMLQHAGVSITITSVTDIVAFIISASTILPSLEAYCIYAAFGVLFTSVFAVTFFTACFTLDQQRIEARRNGILPCIKHKQYKTKCSQRQIANEILSWLYSKVILTLSGKISILIATIILTGFSIESVLRLKQKFDPVWFIPEHTYLSDFTQKSKTYYPDIGYEAGIFLGKLNYTSEITKIQSVVEEFESSGDIVNKINSWVLPFQKYVKKKFKEDIFEQSLPENKWNLFLSKFLFSPRGAKYQANFRFEKPLQCGIPAPNITISTINFNFNKFRGPEEHLPAMHRTHQMVKNGNFTTGDHYAVWAKIFGNWIIDEVIDNEVARNLELALVCVMLCTVVLIVNIEMCFWIFVCVLLTMVNVCGWMQRWGLTIDLVSCIGLELAIGLCVDYAAHIGHTFLTLHGTRQERVHKTVTSIGSAVLYGGFSTLLALSMLSFSKAYIFQAFFKIFLLVVLFGLFHGVVVLPIILSFIGPKPYYSHQQLQINEQ